MGIYALGRLEFAAKFENEDSEVRASLIEAQVFLAYQKQLNNLSIQEGRLRKQHDKNTAELKDLQSQRKQQTSSRFSRAVGSYLMAEREGRPFELAEFGFEFTMEEIQKKAEERKARAHLSVADFLPRKR